MHSNTHGEKGQVLIAVVILFTAIMTTVIVGLTGPILSQVQISKNLQQSKQSYFAAESLAEDMLYRFKTGKTVSASETLTVGGASASANVTTGGGEQTITVSGDLFDLERAIVISLSQGSGIAFNYGLQAGNGGVSMGGGASIDGNIYSNGTIDAVSASITGTAIAANSAALSATIANESPSTPPSSINFRNASASQDFAQSFQVPDETPLNKVQFYIRKVGSPSNATVRLVNDNAGSPSTNTISIGSVSLNAGLVTGSYGWVEVVFTTNPSLIPGTTYWIVIDNSSQSSSNYFTIGAGTEYGSGQAKTGSYGGSWTATSLDGYFRIYTGGFTSYIGGAGYVGGVTIGGNAWASNVRGASVTGNLYCLTGSNNNKSCNTSQGVPPAQSMPFSDANIADWKAQAEAGGTHTGNYSIGWQGATLGPLKITGDLSIAGGGTLTITGPVWVQGNISLGGGGDITLPSTSLGRSVMLVADGRIQINGGGQVISESAGSYLFMVSTSECPNAVGCSSSPAISISGGGGAIAANAQQGTVSISGGAHINAITANQISISGGSSVTYDEGLASPEFVGGPSGGYTIGEWAEIE
ncbi:hypothetical protein C4568_04190 [Candidatus Parcubacteria bacterium]|nr:MAG: hypothetical protein C4568_04190 [Candidatus Parcubacteria bacterium]